MDFGTLSPALCFADDSFGSFCRCFLLLWFSIAIPFLYFGFPPPASSVWPPVSVVLRFGSVHSLADCYTASASVARASCCGGFLIFQCFAFFRYVWPSLGCFPLGMEALPLSVSLSGLLLVADVPPAGSLECISGASVPFVNLVPFSL